MSSISSTPTCLLFAPSNEKLTDKKSLNTILSIPPDVLAKLQAVITNKEGLIGPRKKAIVILASFSGKSIIDIQESLGSENYAKITATRIKAIIRVFNLRIHEAGFLNRFLKEDIGNLRSELIDSAKPARGRERTLTHLEKTYLDSVIALGTDRALIKTAKIIIALSQGLINRKIKEQLGTSINSSQLAKIKKRFINNLEPVQEIVPELVPELVSELVKVHSWDQPVLEPVNEMESAPVTLKISDRLPSPVILDEILEVVAAEPSPPIKRTTGFNPDDLFSEDF